MTRGISGVAVLAAWLALGVTAYLFTLAHITPPTEEARMVTTALFGFIGTNATCAGVIVWVRR